MVERDFWHSGLRNPLLGTARFLTNDVLCLPRGTIAARYMCIFITFALSGTIHMLVDSTAGIPLSENSAMTLFVMQAVGIALEDFVQWLYRTFISDGPPQKQKQKEGARSGAKSSTAWQRIVGYLWVVTWLIWTTPAWSYQNIRHDAGQLIPFSYFGPSKP